MSETIIVGGISGIGRALAVSLLGDGAAVTIAGRDAARARHAAQEILAKRDLPAGSRLHGIGIDLSQPATIAEAVSQVGTVRHIVLAGMVRDQNSLAQYDIARASELATTKIVGSPLWCTPSAPE